MPSRSADWQLLFGLLAFQNGLIDREQVVDSFCKWTTDKSKSVDEFLVIAGALPSSVATTMRQMVELHIQHHGGDAQKSLQTCCRAVTYHRYGAIWSKWKIPI